jgi:hypothetical protein
MTRLALLLAPALTASAADSLALAPKADLQGSAAPQIARRPFSIRLELSKIGTQGVLAAQGGQANGWALILRDSELLFILNRSNERSHLNAKMRPAKVIEAAISLEAQVTLKLDGQELASKRFPGLLEAQPVDGFQLGQDLAAPVGQYKAPFAFDGSISAASMELGNAAPLPPFVGSVPAGGPVPKMEVQEQAQHPYPERDKFGGFTGVKTGATGFFRVEEIKGRWCFITPEGHPFIAIGPNHTGPTIRDQGRHNGLWQRWNQSPDETAKNMLPIIQGMGFTAGDVYQPESTYTRTLPWISFFWYGDSNHTFIDVFDEAAMARVTQRAYEHAKSVADNPWLLGIGGPDLSYWDGKLVRQYRQMKPDAPGRQRYAQFLSERYQKDIVAFNAVYGTRFSSWHDLAAQEMLSYPIDVINDSRDPSEVRWEIPRPADKTKNPRMTQDDYAFCALIAKTLFPQLRSAVKRGAPQHLFLGEHLAVRLIPDEVIAAMAPHVDAYLAQAVEVSPQRPPEWQVFQADRWAHEHALLQKPIIIVDWGAVFSFGEAFENKGATIKPEKEASDEAAQFVLDAFAQPHIIGLFLCKLWGTHGNDERFFQNRAARAYLKPDASEYPYRTDALRKANFEAQRRVFQELRQKSEK